MLGLRGLRGDGGIIWMLGLGVGVGVGVRDVGVEEVGVRG